MKRVLIIIFSFFIILSSSFAEDENFINLAEIAKNLIPGEGDTEVSIDLRENFKPNYSILGVREIEKTDNGNFFTQFSLFNTEKNNDERIVGNLGFGKRILSNENTMMTGLNAPRARADDHRPENCRTLLARNHRSHRHRHRHPCH